MINISVYAKTPDTDPSRLTAVIETLPFTKKLRISNTINGLAQSLRSSKAYDDVAILMISQPEEMVDMLSFKKKLQDRYTMIVLPDRDERHLSVAIQLSPILLCFADSDFSEVKAVLERIDAKAVINSERAEAHRIWPSGFGDSILDMIGGFGYSRNSMPLY
jgi:hypothetical protein